jgi:hypothetical protein
MLFKLPPFEAQSRRQPIQEDIRFQRRSWLSERLSWIGVALIVLLAFGGVFGGAGLLFDETSAAAGGIAIGYEPIARRQAPTELRIDASTPRVTFSQAFDDYLDIVSITPPPTHVERSGGIVYVFAPDLPEGRRHIVLTYKPKTTGWFDGSIASGGQDGVRFRQFVYP